MNRACPAYRAPTASPAPRRPRWRALGSLALGILLSAAAASASPLRGAADAITELDVELAAHLLADVDSDASAVAVERARLALYRGDCVSAATILDAPALAEDADLALLRAVARDCARATAGALTVEDPRAGIWLRLQDSRDEALVPFLRATAVRARDYLERELGVTMPRPLRIEVVRDLFSLAALTGLPVEAAETTGTVGVARFGRIVMVTPRATPRGYPWEDTLAHELVHLFVTRATRDRAPLWLQEGIAKSYESRWRARRPFDDESDADAVAREALRSGRSVGIDGLGASIALLPTPELAATAYAEVRSFVGYWSAQSGPPALRLLFADLRGLGASDPDRALRSVTGYDLSGWNRRWQAELRQGPSAAASPAPRSPLTTKNLLEVRDLVRRVRLAELLAARGHHAAAAAEVGPAVAKAPREPMLRWLAAREELGAGREDAARDRLGGLDDVDSVHGGWFALHGRFAGEVASAATPEREVGLAVDPLLEDVACLGFPRFPRPPADSFGGDDDPTGAAAAASPPADADDGAPVPDDGEWRALCLAARVIPRN